MLIRMIQKKKLAKRCLEIRNETPYFFLGTRRIIDVDKLDEDVSYTKYFLQKLPKNSFCFYEDKQTQVSIAIMTIGKKLYIMPAFFLDYWEKKLRQLGLEKRQLSIPFSYGAIPENLGWIRHYREEYLKAKEQDMIFLEMLGLSD